MDCAILIKFVDNSSFKVTTRENASNYINETDFNKLKDWLINSDKDIYNVCIDDNTSYLLNKKNITQVKFYKR